MVKIHPFRSFQETHLLLLLLMMRVMILGVYNKGFDGI